VVITKRTAKEPWKTKVKKPSGARRLRELIIEDPLANCEQLNSILRNERFDLSPVNFNLIYYEAHAFLQLFKDRGMLKERAKRQDDNRLDDTGR
jgi:hypothetical protein